MYQLFVFFMVTDPKTTVKSKKWQCIVVFFVAFVEMLLRLNQVVHAPLYALFLVGPTAMLIEIWLNPSVRCPCDGCLEYFSRKGAKEAKAQRKRCRAR
jgi:Na+-translocating ferredoxin:NAD+ oxidoreductase RnfD subunit